MKKEKKVLLSKSAASGIVALVFLVLGFQIAIFVVKLAGWSGGDARPRSEPRVMSEPGMADMSEADVAQAGEAAGGFSDREHCSAGGTKNQSSGATSRMNAKSGGVGSAAPKTKLGGYGRPGNAGARSGMTKRTYESFPFDPNTVTVEELQRLGLSPRQAESIENYRAKGGSFRSAADFRKMYVVSDTLYARLEPFIEIPKLELNAADSAALLSLRGIGPWYAHKILDYRERLGGFFSKEQLLEIDGFDQERFSGFADDVDVDESLCRKLDIWSAPDSVLARHPYLGPKAARGIARYRQLYDSSRWSLDDLAKERVLPVENIEKLKKYIEIR